MLSHNTCAAICHSCRRAQPICSSQQHCRTCCAEGTLARRVAHNAGRSIAPGIQSHQAASISRGLWACSGQRPQCLRRSRAFCLGKLPTSLRLKVRTMWRSHASSSSQSLGQTGMSTSLRKPMHTGCQARAATNSHMATSGRSRKPRRRPSCWYAGQPSCLDSCQLQADVGVSKAGKLQPAACASVCGLMSVESACASANCKCSAHACAGFGR